MRDRRQIPGFELVQRGLDDLAAGVDSHEALLVAIAGARLRRIGLELPPPSSLPPEPELQLYRRLRSEHGDGAHSAYNALVRRLVSCERALEAAGGR